MMLDKSSAVASIVLDIIKEKVRTRADLMVGLFYLLTSMKLSKFM